MKIIGHRGAAGYVAENTLASIEHALQLGVDGIEIDIHATRDHHIIVIHDDSLDRTTTGSGRIGDHDLHDLLHVRGRDGRPPPTLRQVLQTIAHRVFLNIEIKDSSAVIGAVELVREFIEHAGWSPRDLLFSSFDHQSTAHVRRIDASLPIGLLVKGRPPSDIWQVAREQNACAINLDVSSVTQEFVRQAHQRELQVWVFTVNQRADADRLRQWGVDAIFSDLPDRVR